MRISQKTIDKNYEFCNHLLQLINYNKRANTSEEVYIDINELISQYKISKIISKLLKDNNVISKVKNGSYEWLLENEDWTPRSLTKEEIKDFLIEYNTALSLRKEEIRKTRLEKEKEMNMDTQVEVSEECEECEEHNDESEDIHVEKIEKPIFNNEDYLYSYSLMVELIKSKLVNIDDAPEKAVALLSELKNQMTHE